MSSNVVLDLSCYGFGNLDDTSLVELNIVGFVLEFDSNSPQHVCTITSTRKETYHGVRRPRRKCWRKTYLMLWRFDNEFFFKLISFLPCVFLQIVKIVLRIECLLCKFGWRLPFKELCYLLNSYGVATLVDKLNALFAYSLLSLECFANFPRIVELLQGPATRATQVIGYQEEDFKRSKTVLWSSVQVEESKEANLGRLEASKTKKGAISGPFQPTVAGRLRVTKEV
ncbi:hypothetical protein M9H77_12149 [Catharanthus roseus]|uniref:Uncharacterized protein n=1 Tax=Catharanthus roseus TaxID=4058 RepID=A0ACC0BGL6_CATRO|nr:hypothetical protein M9H77_12149 [Catharanthus roseus]